MHLVDEEDVAGLQVGEEGGEVALAFDRRAGRYPDLGFHLVREDAGEGRLAEAGRPVEKNVVERLLALLRRGKSYAQVLLNLVLADVFRQPAGPERRFERNLVVLR